MAESVLEVQARKDLGKKATKQLRRLGKLPGIYYFHGQDSIPVTIDEKALRQLLHAETNIVDLHFEDGDETKCVIREIQWDPIFDRPLHVDFMGIKLTESISVSVPLHLIGTPVGVSQQGGVLQHIIREIELEGLPLDLPEHIDVDVSNLDIGDAIRVEDLSIEKVTILDDMAQTIAVVRPPTVVAEPTEEAEEEIAEEPELVGKEKADEEVDESTE